MENQTIELRPQRELDKKGPDVGHNQQKRKRPKVPPANVIGQGDGDHSGALYRKSRDSGLGTRHTGSGARDKGRARLALSRGEGGPRPALFRGQGGTGEGSLPMVRKLVKDK
jgi:hypothetical protein